MSAMITSLFLFILVSQVEAARTGQIDLSRYNLRPFYANDFSKAQKIAREEDLIENSTGIWRRKARPANDAEWIAEGWGDAEVRNGKLLVSPVSRGQRSHMVVWNRRIFPADFLLEVEMNPRGSTNGLTIVFFCAAGVNGEDIFDLALPPRRADYQAYHSGALANYSDAYWSRNTEAESISNRLRKNPGFKQVAEGPSMTTGATDVTHHLRILKIGAHIEVEINGRIVIRWDDPEGPLGTGRIGLRSMDGVTMVAYDNFKLWQVTPRKKG